MDTGRYFYEHYRDALLAYGGSVVEWEDLPQTVRSAYRNGAHRLTEHLVGVMHGALAKEIDDARSRVR
jgi:hypothetical protein